MTIFDLLQLIGGFIIVAGYIPQIRQIKKTRNVEGISLTFWSWLVVAGCLIEANAIASGQMTFMISQTLNLIGASIITYQVLKYRKK